MNVVARAYRKKQLKKNFKAVKKYMSKLMEDYPIVDQNETCAYNIHRISTFRHRAEFMQRYLPTEDFVIWANAHRNAMDEMNKFTPDVVKQTISFPKEILRHRQELSDSDFRLWQNVNINQYDLFERLTGIAPNVVNQTLSFPNEVLRQRQNLSDDEFIQWQNNNAYQYSLYEQLTGITL